MGIAVITYYATSLLPMINNINSMDYFAECLEKFSLLPKENRDVFGSIEVVKALSQLEIKYNIKLEFLVILIAIRQLTESDIEEYLKEKYNLDEKTAKEINNELQEKILKPAAMKLNQPQAKQNIIEPEKEIKNIVGIFSKNLVSSFMQSRKELDYLNKKIIYIIAKEEKYKRQLEKTLYSNNERLTDKDFSIEGKSSDPTVANWILDFIKSYGTGPFDNLKLADYLANSSNVKKIDLSERKLVSKILQLYRNLKFFPESIEGLTPEKWEIIPTSPLKANIEEIKRQDKVRPDFHPANEDLPKARHLEEMAKKMYLFSVPEQELIKQEEDDIKRITRGNIIMIGKELAKSLENKDRPRTIASLRLAAKNNLLIGWAQKNDKDLIGFLKDILEVRLGISENEAAKIGVHLYNLFKKLGRDVGYLSYFDEVDSRFKWVEKK